MSNSVCMYDLELPLIKKSLLVLTWREYFRGFLHHELTQALRSLTPANSLTAVTLQFSEQIEITFMTHIRQLSSEMLFDYSSQKTGLEETPAVVNAALHVPGISIS